MFGHEMSNSSVMFHTDNTAVRDVVNAQTAKCPTIMSILRPLVLLLIKHNIHLRAKHVPGVENTLCDRISRFQVDAELLERFNMNPHPEVLPLPLRPENYMLK